MPKKIMFDRNWRHNTLSNEIHIKRLVGGWISSVTLIFIRYNFQQNDKKSLETDYFCHEKYFKKNTNFRRV